MATENEIRQMNNLVANSQGSSGFFGGIKIVIAAIVISLMISIFLSDSDYDVALKSARDNAAVDNIEVVTAGKLSKAYSNNEVAADSRFKGRKLSFVGRVSAIKSDVFNKPVLVFSGGLLLSDVSARLSSDLQRSDYADTLKKGQSVNLVCIGNGEVLSRPLLTDCRLPS